MQVVHLVQQMGNSELDMPVRDFLDTLNTPASLYPNLVYFKLNFYPTYTYDLHLTFFPPSTPNTIFYFQDSYQRIKMLCPI